MPHLGVQMLKLPKNKFDVECAEEIVANEWSEVSHLMPDLFEWTQDPNWPVAQILYPFFVKHSIEVIEEVRKVLQSKDDIWKSFLLDNLIIQFPKEHMKLLSPELKAMSSFVYDKNTLKSVKTIIELSEQSSKHE